MKKITFIIIFLLIVSQLFAQNQSERIEGKVTYISSDNVYVRFESTRGIESGDTLYLSAGEKTIPVLIVKNFSSLSCICKPIQDEVLIINSIIFARIKPKEIPTEVKIEKTKEAVEVKDIVLQETKTDQKKKKEKAVEGKLSVSSYSYLNQSNSSQRLRYNLSIKANEIAETPLSAEAYINFTQRMSDRVPYNHDLKIYSMAVDYKLNDNSRITLGRKLNPGMANIGAVDGVQYENKKDNFSYGALLGSRPDMTTYGYNPNLMQIGAFASHQMVKNNLQTTIAFFNQMNNWNTDRRFLYIQHSNMLLKNVNFFSSFEVDLFAVENSKPVTSLNLTSAYLSLRYKPLNQLSLSLNYDARKNVYYYETFKNFADSVYDKETRQGIRLQVLYRPSKNISWNTFTGYRLPTSIDNASYNAHTAITWNDLPLISSNLTLNASYLNTGSLNGTILGIDLSKDFLSGKMNATFQYEHVNYNFIKTGNKMIQNLVELGMYYRINKKWMISANTEGVLETDLSLNWRLFMNLSMRF